MLEAQSVQISQTDKFYTFRLFKINFHRRNKLVDARSCTIYSCYQLLSNVVNVVRYMLSPFRLSSVVYL